LNNCENAETTTTTTKKIPKIPLINSRRGIHMAMKIPHQQQQQPNVAREAIKCLIHCRDCMRNSPEAITS
jgi:hypothetical protein